MERAEFDFIKDALSQIIDDIGGNPDWSDAASAISADLGALERELEGKVVSPGKSLEEAADTYAEKHGFRVPYDGSDNYYDKVDVKASKEGFIAGAKWQKQHDAPPSCDKLYDAIKQNREKKAFHDAFEAACYTEGMIDGVKWHKEQMMKEAVEGGVMTNGFYPYEPCIVASYPNCPYAIGDNVRIVVLKAEEE